MAGPIRVATAALSRRIYAGRANKAGDALLEPRHDVTADVIKAVVEHFGEDTVNTLTLGGVPAIEITIRKLPPADSGGVEP